ncbi:hypothetical protein GM672_26435 [Massilia buxea]|uniref:Uncharacterized protein n=1 Tax=Pseudoduganella buxea TaxID=1949069 RepID=A0A6I3T3V1_9BURK|nr:hypothetical protein [Pseudoduganella buxea]
MAVTKTEVVSVRVPPDVKAALVAAAEQERCIRTTSRCWRSSGRRPRPTNRTRPENT